MTQVAIVYHSGYGHTAEQAKAVARGAQKVAGVDVVLLTSDEAQQQFDQLKAADAIIFGSPTYMGSASAQFKAFMDASSKAWFTQDWKDKIAAGFTNSGSQNGDKLSTLN
jgi:NAD(P)H dehydrogenase (quinone)